MAFGLKFYDAPQGSTPVRAAPTAVLGTVLITTWGPTEGAVETTAQPEWERVFGGPTTSGFGYLYIKAAYDIVGPGFRVVTKRTQHYSDISNAASKTSTAATSTSTTDALAATAGAVTSTNPHPHNLEPGQTLLFAIDANAGVPTYTTVTFNAAAALRECANAETYNIADGDTLLVKIDRGGVQTIIFSASEFVLNTAATAEEVAGVINAQLNGGKATVTTSGTKVTITSDVRGDDSYVEVTGGTANSGGSGTKLGFSTAETTNAQSASNVADIDAVTFDEEKALIEAAVTGCTVTDAAGYTKITSNTTGTGSKVRVSAGSTARTAVGLDTAIHTGGTSGTVNRATISAKYDGLRGNNLAYKWAAPSNGDSMSRNLQAYENGLPTGTVQANLSFDTASPDYFVSRLNDSFTGSDLFTVADLDEDSTDLPALGLSANLTGGADGVAGLTDADFTGNQLAKTGLYGLDATDAVPGTTAITLLTLPDRATSAAHNAAITYAEVYREGLMVFLVDLPSGLTAAAAVAYVNSTASLQGLSNYSGVLYDRVQVANSRPDVYGTAKSILIPNSGVYAGVMARTDSRKPEGGGVWDPPAGKKRGGVGGVVFGLEIGDAADPQKFELLRSNRINCFYRNPATSAYYIRGSDTLRADGQFNELQEIRGAIFLKRSLEGTYQGVLDDPTEEGLREAEAGTKAFLRKQTDPPIKAFRSTDYKLAWSVDFGPSLNRASTMTQGEGNASIAIATKRGLKKLNIFLGQHLADVQAELAALQAT